MVRDRAAGFVLLVRFLWALPPLDLVVAAILWWNHGAEPGYSRGMMIFLVSVSPTLNWHIRTSLSLIGSWSVVRSVSSTVLPSMVIDILLPSLSRSPHSSIWQAVS